MPTASVPSDEILRLVKSGMDSQNHAVAVDTARKIEALFAEILAEKELDKQHLTLELVESERLRSRQAVSIVALGKRIEELEARAMVAEAALA